MFVLMTFNPPLRPTSIAITAYAPAESLPLHHSVGLSMVKNEFDIKSDPLSWPHSFLKLQLDKIIRMIRVERIEGTVFQLTLMNSEGPDKPMAPLLSSFQISKRIVAKKVNYFLDTQINDEQDVDDKVSH